MEQRDLGSDGSTRSEHCCFPKRTFVVREKTDQGAILTGDRGLSWYAMSVDEPDFLQLTFDQWLEISPNGWLQIDESGWLLRSVAGGTVTETMGAWRIPLATSVLHTL